MKRVITAVTLSSLFICSLASAQEPEPAPEKQGTDVSLLVRGGMTFDVALANPNFYGIGGLVEPTVSINDQFGAGLRIDGMALFGVGLGDDVQAGIRVLAGILPKVEYKPWRGPAQLVVGLAGGYYTVAIVGASVSGDREDVGALAGGGQAFGIAPQIGFEFGSFRIAALSHLVFGGELEPVFALELSWNTFQLDL